MNYQINSRSFRSLLRLTAAAIALVFIISVQGFAQKLDYRPGERIEYKANPAKDVWEEGTFVEKTYDGSQPVIRFKPDQYFPKGEQKALADWNQIRPVQHTPKVEPENNAPVNPVVPADRGLPVGDAMRGGVMTKAEVLAYMREHGYANGVAKQDAKVCKDLIETIKKRGVSDRLEYGKDDVSPITSNG